MKFELIILAITAFFIFNIYSDGKYTKMIFKYKKYYQMIFFAFLGITFYLLVKKNPLRCKSLLLHANNAVKYMPIDKTSMDMLSPILDFTSSKSDDSNGYSEKSFMEHFNDMTNTDDNADGGSLFSPQNKHQQNAEKRLLQSGSKTTKRSVSETKKKYVASMQNWKCGDCQKQLNAWFEVDHKVRLEYGGGNEVENLLALCRECHGKKTAHENM
jgi:hypothetical protein